MEPPMFSANDININVDMYVVYYFESDREMSGT